MSIIEDTVLGASAPEVSQPAIFSALSSVADPEALLSRLLKETHIAISAMPDETDHVSTTLRDLLSQIQPPEPVIEAANTLFRSANFETIFEVGDEILTAAKEHALRDSEPERTLDVHVREMLDAGDEPTALFNVIEAWHNQAHDPQKNEEIRLTVAEEWARKLALEQQSAETINASLKLHLPDSNIEGHNHAAVATRIHAQVHGGDPHLTQAAPSMAQPEMLPQHGSSLTVDPHPELGSSQPMPRR